MPARISRRAPVRRLARGAAGAVRSEPATGVTHPERLVFPQGGIRKAELAEYYATLAPALWPHLQRRPLSILRSVTTGRTFWQRHLDIPAITGFARVRPGVRSTARKEFFASARPEALSSLAQMAAVELHTWGCRLPRTDRADRITFDVDPDPDLPWSSVRRGVLAIRELLTAIGLESRLKTSGGNGLHVVVPLSGRLPDFAAAAGFARAVAIHLAEQSPELFTARRGATNRRSLLYVDWQRNQEGATTVCAYSPRWRPGAPISTPLDWSELGARDLRGAHFNLRNALTRWRRVGDPWLEAPCKAQTLHTGITRALDRLAG
jgi:bifunctional non-homologous end joining protein LigD